MATALAKRRPRRVFECGQEARALDQEVAITSPPSSVRLVSSLRIDWVGGIEIVLGLLVCVLLKRKKQKARPKGVNLKVRWRAKVAKCDSVLKRAPTALYWCGNVSCDDCINNG